MFDLVIIGSGPAGIYAGYLAKMHNLKFKLIESSSEIGGQMLLFKDKPVYDMPGQNNVNGKKVLKSLISQFDLTNEKINLNEKLIDIKGGFPSFVVQTSLNKYKTKCIIMATGGGLFEPNKLGIENENLYENISYSVESVNKYKNKNLIIFGGGDSAIDWAHFLKNICKEVVLVHRREQFRAQEKLINDLRETIKIYTPFKLINVKKSDKYTRVEIQNVKSNEIKIIECDEILVFYGQKKTLNRENSFDINMNQTSYIVKSNMETNKDGIFAIGNVAGYDGKINVLATALGEAATAIGSVVYKVYPGKKMSYIKNKIDS